MKPLKRALTWCALLNKRLLQRPLFLAILLLIPVLALALNAASAGGSGVVTVALCPGEGDTISRELTESLLAEQGVLRYVRCDTAEEARALVTEGGADTAWIFTGDTETALRENLRGERTTALLVVEREGNVFLQLAREKVYAALYPALSRVIFTEVLERESGAVLRDAELEPYFRHVEKAEDIVTFTYGDSPAQRPTDYLRAPVRGLLAVLIVLSGLSGAAMLASDRERGALIWTGERAALPLTAAYTLLPMLDTALMAWLALTLGGLTASPGREALLLLLLVLAGSGFCGLVGKLCGRAERIGPAALLLTVAMLALCPIFLSLRGLRFLSALLPPWYYLYGAAESVYGWYLLVYAAAAWLLLALCLMASGRAVPRQEAR